MSEENLRVVRTAYEAFQRGDVETINGLLHPDLEIFQCPSLPWGGHYRGAQGARDFFRKIKESVASVFEPDNILDSGDAVVVIGHAHGRINRNGLSFRVSAVHVWRIRDGKAVRFEAFIDAPAMLRYLSM